MLSSSPNWREIDKNVERLIDDLDVPRATSAPPHLQEGRWGGPQQVSLCAKLNAFPGQCATVVKSERPNQQLAAHEGFQVISCMSGLKFQTGAGERFACERWALDACRQPGGYQMRRRLRSLL